MRNMTRREIFEALQQLPLFERLALMESILRMISEEFKQREFFPADSERKNKMIAASEALLADYTSDRELTAFTALDGEDFHA